jgi:hypothetical protein
VLLQSPISLALPTRTTQRKRPPALSVSSLQLSPVLLADPIPLALPTRTTQRMRLPALSVPSLQALLLSSVLLPTPILLALLTRMPPTRSPAAVSEQVLALDLVRLSALTTLTSADNTTDLSATLPALASLVPLSLSPPALWRPLRQLRRPASFLLVVLSRRQILLVPPSRMSPILRLERAVLLRLAASYQLPRLLVHLSRMLPIRRLDRVVLLHLAASCPFLRLLERLTRTTQPPIHLPALQSALRPAAMTRRLVSLRLALSCLCL